MLYLTTSPLNNNTFLMQTASKKFIHSKQFKLLALIIYIYSFIQMDADESPIKVDLIELDDPLAMKKIQLQIERPMKVLIRLMGKDDSTTD